jgi:hypothetical protein
MKDQLKHPWPILRFEELKETIATVHLWTQIVGKIRLENMPWLNHSWHVTLYISPRGLTTGSIPYGSEIFQIDFDFISHELIILSSSGKQEKLALYPRSVASFYEELFRKLKEMGIKMNIHPKPNEVVNAIPFLQDEEHNSYDANGMNLLWRAFIKADVVFTRFRALFTGKASPVHFFWGSFDLAVTRFSGRTAPKHPGGAPNMPDRVMQEAYSHEVSSCGFWPGNAQSPIPVFYSYCYPTPQDFGRQAVEPSEAFFSEDMGEFFLPYESVQNSADPDDTLMRFLLSTYKAAAKTGHWEENLECNLSYLE